MAEENITPEGAVATDAPQDDTTDNNDVNDTENGSDADTDAGSDAGTERVAPEQSVIVPQPELSASLSTGTDEDAPRREVEGGRSYEIIFITRAGDQDATDTATERLRAQVEDNGGAVDNVRTSEVRRLAYPIAKEIEGIYTVVNARFTTDRISEIDRFFKLEESVLRHMILREEQ